MAADAGGRSGRAARAGVAPREIAAVGIANQRETTLAWNRHTGRPYHNAIVWQDTRTDALCAALSEHGGQDRFRPQTGLPLTTYFSGPKIRWLLDETVYAPMPSAVMRSLAPLTAGWFGSLRAACT